MDISIIVQFANAAQNLSCCMELFKMGKLEEGWNLWVETIKEGEEFKNTPYYQSFRNLSKAVHFMYYKYQDIEIEKLSKETKENTNQVVYFIYNSATNSIKIGTTTDIENRMKALQCANSQELILLNTVPGDKLLELELHKEFAKYRLEGEWFKADTKLLKKIKALVELNSM